MNVALPESEVKNVSTNHDSCVIDRVDTKVSDNWFQVRFIYNPKVNPRHIEALLVKKSKNCNKIQSSVNAVVDRTVWGRFTLSITRMVVTL